MTDTKLLVELCSVPTAPFAEGRVRAYVERFVGRRAALRLRADRAGNLLIELPGRRRGGPRWVFTAHMDHPGLVARAMADRSTVEADFRGGVLGQFVAGARVRFFDGEREIPGRVVEVESDRQTGQARRAMVRVRRAVSPGALGMFDVGAGRLRGGRFSCRCVDDLAGAAAALAMLDRLGRDRPRSTVAVLLTRGEEQGFVGAIAASRRPTLLRKSDRIVAIECSAMQPSAPQGQGPIIRIGDKTSVFNSSLSWFLTRQAEKLAQEDPAFAYQRALMPGGTCEATVYDVYGFIAGSICVALGNYHNMDRQRQKIAAEYIDVNDWRQMVRLFVRIARRGHEYEPGHRALREILERRFAGSRHLL